MTETAEVIHVTFSLSSAGTIRQALALLGRTERVVVLSQDLSIGPIDPPDPQIRDAWGVSVLGARVTTLGELEGDPASVEKAWAEATAPDAHPVFWGTKHSPMDYACLLAFASRVQDRSFDIIDGTDLDCMTFRGVSQLLSWGMMRPEDVITFKVFERRRPFSLEERRSAAVAWSRLQRENAPFRIVRAGQLVSAPLNHYDTLLIRLASRDWEIAPRLIGRLMTSFFRTPNGDITGDTVLFGRMLALSEAGLLEVAGPGPTMRDFQVRRPSPAARS